jgi:hypothetical protein
VEVLIESDESTPAEALVDAHTTSPAIASASDDDADRTYNGYTFLRVPARCTQFDLAQILGVSHTQIQLKCYELGLHLTPKSQIAPNFVRKIMAGYDCVPSFKS